jgi:hypothetical protein
MPVPACLPGAQVLQPAAPTSFCVDPSGQLWQTLLPVVAANVPEAHGVHSVVLVVAEPVTIFVVLLPSAQATQASCPATD